MVQYGITTIAFNKNADNTYTVVGIRKSNGKAIVRTFSRLENADLMLQIWDDVVEKPKVF